MFCDLAESGSFTKAAQTNGVTQSAVSQQVSSLERQLGCLLIERSKKKFRLTREGQLLYEHGRQIVQAHDTLLSRLQEVKHIVSGSIRVATIYSIGLHDLPPYLKQFLRAHPTINIHVEYQRANQVYNDVLGNVVDLGLVAYPEPDPRLECILLRNEVLSVICHPSHPLARATSLQSAQLQDQRFIAFEPDIPTRKALDHYFQDQQVSVRTVMEFDNIETVKRAVEVGSGISIVPEGTVSDEVAKGILRLIPLADRSLLRPLAVLHRKSKVLTPAMRQFIELLGSTGDRNTV